MFARTSNVLVAALFFDRAGKRYGRAVALHDLSLSVEPGEIFGFLGPNGAGKTTAIHLAMGFVRLTAGRGELLGLPFERAQAGRAHVGYVPDAPVFFKGSTLDAVLLAAQLNCRTTTGLRERAVELLRWMDLAAAQDARKLSRGQAQRLALVQALVTRPELLILDEPTSALDPPAVALLREALLRARGEGAAVFFSSHQLDEVEQLCDRAAFLEGGRLLHAGSMAALLEEGAMAHVTLRGLRRDDSFVRERLPLLQGRSSGSDLVFAMPITDQRSFLEQAWLAGAELVRVERERRTLADLFARHRSKPEGGAER